MDLSVLSDEKYGEVIKSLDDLSRMQEKLLDENHIQSIKEMNRASTREQLKVAGDKAKERGRAILLLCLEKQKKIMESFNKKN